MAKKGKKKDHGQDILESPEVLADQLSKTEQFFAKNKILTTVVLIGIIVVVSGILGYRYYNNVKNDEAQSEMFQAQFYFENDSLSLALNGDGINLGFVDIVDQYGETKAGNLANYYAGAIYLKQGKYDLALLFLQDFKSDDLLVQARAYSLMGDIFMEQSNFAEAVKYYNRAAEYKPNEEFSPLYLTKAAIAYEKNGDIEEAIEAYRKIIEDFRSSDQVQNARKNLGRLGG